MSSSSVGACVESLASHKRVRSEVKQKVPEAMMASVVVPEAVRGQGSTIRARFPRAALGDGDFTRWGYQVVMQSNEGFPAGTDFLTRVVNEYEGQHRFGGGTDHNCDPHVLDVLAGSGSGAATEIAAQHEMLRYQCGEDGQSLQRAVLKMVRRGP